jgi:hypothetical protein
MDFQSRAVEVVHFAAKRAAISRVLQEECGSHFPNLVLTSDAGNDKYSQK